MPTQSAADVYGKETADVLIDRLMLAAKTKLPPFLIDNLPVDKIKLWIADILARTWETGYEAGKAERRLANWTEDL